VGWARTASPKANVPTTSTAIRVPFIAHLSLGCSFIVCAQERLEPAEAFELAREGAPGCSIVTAERPTPAARLAALELQYHLLKISGARIPIHSETERVEGRRVLVGESSATRRFGIRSGDFKPQEYLIALRPETIILVGRDWEDTEANRKVEGRPMAGETLQGLRHKIDYWFSFVNAWWGQLPLGIPKNQRYRRLMPFSLTTALPMKVQRARLKLKRQIPQLPRIALSQLPLATSLLLSIPPSGKTLWPGQGLGIQ
jgi:hypothetical protein